MVNNGFIISHYGPGQLGDGVARHCRRPLTSKGSAKSSMFAMKRWSPSISTALAPAPPLDLPLRFLDDLFFIFIISNLSNYPLLSSFQYLICNNEDVITGKNEDVITGNNNVIMM